MKKWKYHSENFGGNIHSAVEFINEFHPEWDVVQITSISGYSSIIVWRELISES